MNMNITIKTNVGYTVVRSKDNTRALLKDGDDKLFIANLMDFEGFKMEQVQNECLRVQEVFNTVKGNKYIYWVDIESGKDYLTRATSND